MKIDRRWKPSRPPGSRIESIPRRGADAPDVHSAPSPSAAAGSGRIERGARRARPASTPAAPPLKRPSRSRARRRRNLGRPIEPSRPPALADASSPCKGRYPRFTAEAKRVKDGDGVQAHRLSPHRPGWPRQAPASGRAINPRATARALFRCSAAIMAAAAPLTDAEMVFFEIPAGAHPLPAQCNVPTETGPYRRAQGLIAIGCLS